jgi:predicted Rossmann-fold nucleotide-binding protein
MEDVSKGAKLAGGKTIGVTYYRDKDISYKTVNEFIDEEIKTSDIFERINTMMKISDGFIVLHGGTGTLLELSAVLEHINKGMVPPKPIIAIGEYWKGVVNNLNNEEILNPEAKQRFNITKCSELVTFANDIEEAAKMISDRI